VSPGLPVRRRGTGRAVFRALAGLLVAATVAAAGAAVPRNGAAGWVHAAAADELQTAVVVTQRGRFAFAVELADTPQTRSRGLQGRPTLAADHGMLFDFGRTGPVAMWMKDTPVSLDMVFLDERGRVIGIAHRTTPGSREVIQSPAPARAVLEVAAGTAGRLKLAAGDRVIHPMFPAP
jgi:uncharacterized membrane protein (UPF0127 family)